MSNSLQISAVDVLVVGATPAGLAAALAYARLGLSVRIVEAHSGLSYLTGSVTLNSRSLELLEALQVVDQIIQAGHKIENLEIRNAKFQKVGALNFSHLPHKYAYLIALSQHELENILMQALSPYGVQVEFGTVVESQHQEELSVVSVLKTQQGLEQGVVSKILVAAEGEFSSIRQKLKIGFGLTEYQHYWSLADIETDWDYGDATCCLLSNGLLYVQRIKNNKFRVISNLPNAHTYLPKPLQNHELLWQTERRVMTHQVRSYQYGRIFFVGDCAHQHGPLEGRDLSMGLEDAVTLVAMTLDQCLEQYHDHRYKANLRVLYHSEKLLRWLGQSPSPSLNKMKTWVLKNLLGSTVIQSKIIAGISGI